MKSASSRWSPCGDAIAGTTPTQDEPVRIRCSTCSPRSSYRQSGGSCPSRVRDAGRGQGATACTPACRARPPRCAPGGNDCHTLAGGPPHAQRVPTTERLPGAPCRAADVGSGAPELGLERTTEIRRALHTPAGGGRRDSAMDERRVGQIPPDGLAPAADQRRDGELRILEQLCRYRTDMRWAPRRRPPRAMDPRGGPCSRPECDQRGRLLSPRSMRPPTAR